MEARLNACGDWQLWETVVGQDTKLNVQKLDRGTSYQFRVLALNKAGKSQASHPSRGKEARAQNCECFSTQKPYKVMLLNSSR